MIDREMLAPLIADRVRAAVERNAVVDVFPGGATATARLDRRNASIIWVAPPGCTQDAILRDALSAVTDSLLVEVVRDELLDATNFDIADALEAARRGGEQDYEDLKAEAWAREIPVPQ